jgi:hypothetical protein
VVLLSKHKCGQVLESVHFVGAAGPNWPATRTESDVSKGFFPPGGCHVYLHLDEVSGRQRDKQAESF